MAGWKGRFTRYGSTAIRVAVCTGLATPLLAAELNLAPDCTGAYAVPDDVWPPNHRMKSIQIRGVTDPEDEPLSLQAQCIQQDEPSHPMNGHLGWYDADGLGTDTPKVRATRLLGWYIDWDEWRIRRADGRQYDIVFSATDAGGAQCRGTVTVKVPIAPPFPVQDDGNRYSSVPGGVNCDAQAINNPPIIYSGPVLDAQVGVLYEYPVTGHDPDQDALHYQLLDAPEGMAIDADTGVIEWTPLSDQDGVQTVVAAVADTAGLTATQTFDVTVESAADDLSAAIIANPTAGTSPLTVRFSPNVDNHGSVITGYAWDFNGDGTTDRSDNFGAPQTYTYSGTPGDTFEAVLTVTLASGDPLVATQTIVIENRPPIVNVSSSVTNGHVPLAVEFSVHAEDPQGLSEVSIDYEGDGTFDDVQTTELTSGDWTFNTTYDEEGVYNAVVRVTDALGAETRVTNNAVRVDVNNALDPIVGLVASPVSGPVPLSVTLSASVELFDVSEVAQWQWDLDGDGVFETAGGTEPTDSVVTTYRGLDHYYPTVQVTTSSDRTARASVHVQTESGQLPALSIPNDSDTINTDAGEVATLNISLPFDTELELWMEDASGLRVATLQSPQWHETGDHSFQWEGTDTAGQRLQEGDYYAVLGYTAFGTQQELDLRTSTGGALSYYRRSEANPRTFNRLKQPLRINYGVDNPAEVSFFWQISFGDRLMTLLEHERMGRGQYSLYWNGEYPSGKKISDSLQALMPGIVRYDLPYNVVFLKETPRIEGYQLTSTLIADPRREPIGLEVTLSKASTLEVVVSDMDKGVDVATRVYTDLEAGDHHLEWDGRNDSDQYLAPGDYRVGVRSVDSRGNRSLYWYRTQRIDY